MYISERTCKRDEPKVIGEIYQSRILVCSPETFHEVDNTPSRSFQLKRLLSRRRNLKNWAPSVTNQLKDLERILHLSKKKIIHLLTGAKMFSTAL